LLTNNPVFENALCFCALLNIAENRYNCDNFEDFSNQGFMLQVEGGEMINKRKQLKPKEKEKVPEA